MRRIKWILEIIGTALDIRDISSLINRFLQAGGVAGVVVAIWNWLSANVPPLSLWLGGIGLFALALSLWPNIIRLLKLLSPIAKKPRSEASVLAPNSIQFFSRRPQLSWYRERLRETKTVWAMWIIGESAVTGDLLKEAYFQKLLLLAEDSPSLHSISTLMNRPTHQLQRAILRLTAQARIRDKNSIRWYRDLTPSLITIGEPDEEKAWVHIETYLAGVEADFRPSVYFRKVDDPDWFRIVRDGFLKTWDTADTLAPRMSRSDREGSQL
jgi:hypothetical protein